MRGKGTFFLWQKKAQLVDSSGAKGIVFRILDEREKMKEKRLSDFTKRSFLFSLVSQSYTRSRLLLRNGIQLASTIPEKSRRNTRNDGL